MHRMLRRICWDRITNLPQPRSTISPRLGAGIRADEIYSPRM